MDMKEARHGAGSFLWGETMLVIQQVGRYAGETIDMPYAVAQSCITNGTARLPETSIERKDKISKKVPVRKNAQKRAVK